MTLSDFHFTGFRTEWNSRERTAELLFGGGVKRRGSPLPPFPGSITSRDASSPFERGIDPGAPGRTIAILHPSLPLSASPFCLPPPCPSREPSTS
ncbi:hypothetical protein CEXT_401391 [Caerostris extrusa]|uniref:Uncharacterized protein n=1 Tax=Caerostris extrusa TaxID=172846 RepID=A0AAV4PSN1_CAEEX|nr:hypothetical protein CEXT_401391 [Caerostris extrusa]